MIKMKSSLTYWVRVNYEIGGGTFHEISCHRAAILGGFCNTVHGHCSVVGGGSHNCITSGYSGIFSGCNNVVAGHHSAILGGCNNNVGAGYNYVGVFGCNINAAMSCSFHSNELFVQNMPDQTVGGLPFGALYYCTTTCAVHIKC